MRSRRRGRIGCGSRNCADVPSAAQCRVQVHFGHQLREPIDDQRLLRTEQRTLGIEERQVAVHATAVTVLGQVVIGLVGRDEVALGRELVGERLAGGEAIGDFLEGALDGFFVLRHADVFLQLGVVEAGARAAWRGPR